MRPSSFFYNSEEKIENFASKTKNASKGRFPLPPPIAIQAWTLIRNRNGYQMEIVILRS